MKCGGYQMIMKGRRLRGDDIEEISIEIKQGRVQVERNDTQRRWRLFGKFQKGRRDFVMIKVSDII